MKSSRAGKGGEPGGKAEKHERKELEESASPESDIRCRGSQDTQTRK